MNDVIDNNDKDLQSRTKAELLREIERLKDELLDSEKEHAQTRDKLIETEKKTRSSSSSRSLTN